MSTWLHIGLLPWMLASPSLPAFDAVTPDVSVNTPEGTVIFDHVLATTGTKATFSGKGILRVRAQGIRVKTRRKWSPPGTLFVRIDSGPRISLRLKRAKDPDLQIPDQPKWSLTRSLEWETQLPAGEHTITLRSRSKGGTLVQVLFASNNRTAPGPIATKPAPNENLDVTEPTLLGPEPELTTDAPTTEQPGYETVAAPDTQVLIARGDDPAEAFTLVTPNDRYELKAVGPGVLVFDVHAHRDPELPQTLDPLLLSLLVDDVLTETISLEQPASEVFRADGRAFKVSQRVTLRVPVYVGRHKVSLALSDAALHGISIRSQFSPEGTEPDLQTADETIANALSVDAPAPVFVPVTQGSLALSAAAGAWLPSGSGGGGGALFVDATLGTPLAENQLAVGANAGFGFAIAKNSYRDPRSQSSATVTSSTVTLPLWVDVRWYASLTEEVALELGVGGGTAITSVTSESGGTSNDTGFGLVPLGASHISALWCSPEQHCWMARVVGMLTGTQTRNNIRNYDFGGLFFALGYRLGTPYTL